MPGYFGGRRGEYFLRPSISRYRPLLPQYLLYNICSITPCSKGKIVAKMLKGIHAQESKKAAQKKAKVVVEELRSMKLKRPPSRWRMELKRC